MTCPPDYVCRMYPAWQDAFGMGLVVALLVGLLIFCGWLVRR